MNIDFDQFVVDCSFDDAFVEVGGEGIGQDCGNIKPHVF